MNRRSVNSSNLRSIGYDEVQQILEIEFQHGGIYQYSGVPLSKYRGLMSASSHGTYHATYIKDTYPYRKVR